MLQNKILSRLSYRQLRFRHIIYIVLRVTAHILRALTLENLDDNLDDERKPNHHHYLQRDQKGQKAVCNVGAEADYAARVHKRLDEARPVVWYRKRALEIYSRAAVASVGRQTRKVVVDAPAGDDEQDVAGEHPRQDKEAKEDVADPGKAQVLEALGELGMI